MRNVGQGVFITWVDIADASRPKIQASVIVKNACELGSGCSLPFRSLWRPSAETRQEKRQQADRPTIDCISNPLPPKSQDLFLYMWKSQFGAGILTDPRGLDIQHPQPRNTNTLICVGFFPVSGLACSVQLFTRSLQTLIRIFIGLFI